MIKVVTCLEFKAKQHKWKELYHQNQLSGTYKRQRKTQYAFLVKQPLLYVTHWDITSDKIRERRLAYKASPTTDSTTPLIPIFQLPLLRTLHEVPSDKIRLHHCRIAYNNYIACLLLISLIAVYNTQVQQLKIDQLLRNNCFCVMTQLSKTLCYWR